VSGIERDCWPCCQVGRLRDVGERLGLGIAHTVRLCLVLWGRLLCAVSFEIMLVIRMIGEQCMVVIAHWMHAEWKVLLVMEHAQCIARS
jgi:hypothetical protein